MKHLWILSLIFLCSCKPSETFNYNDNVVFSSINQSESKNYQSRSKEVQSLWIEKNGITTKRIAYLPNFNASNEEDWKALIHYGKEKSKAAVENENAEIVYFVLSENISEPADFSEFEHSLNKKIFAQFNGWCVQNGLNFQVHNYHGFEKSFFNNYRQSFSSISEEFPSVLLF
ncbi:hypothetical protein [Sessilibacter sp. MAH2]